MRWLAIIFLHVLPLTQADELTIGGNEALTALLPGVPIVAADPRIPHVTDTVAHGDTIMVGNAT